MSLDAHRFDVTVHRRPEEAFDLFVLRIGDWWPPQYTKDAGSLRTVGVEPYVGGAVYADHGDRGRHDWGTVAAFEPPRHIAVDWTLAQSSGTPSLVMVTFSPVDDDTAVHLEHGGWNDSNAADRDKFTDWPIILDRYVAFADRSAD